MDKTYLLEGFDLDKSMVLNITNIDKSNGTIKIKYWS